MLRPTSWSKPRTNTTNIEIENNESNVSPRLTATAEQNNFRVDFKLTRSGINGVTFFRLTWRWNSLITHRTDVNLEDAMYCRDFCLFGRSFRWRQVELTHARQLQTFIFGVFLSKRPGSWTALCALLAESFVKECRGRPVEQIKYGAVVE